MSGLQMFQSVFTFPSLWRRPRAGWLLTANQENRYLSSFRHVIFEETRKNEISSISQTCCSVKGSIVLRILFFFLPCFFTTKKKETEQKWGKAKPQCEGKNNPLVSSEAGALQGSFSNNCTMFSFPLKDYISALEPIPSDWKHLININLLWETLA